MWTFSSISVSTTLRQNVSVIRQTRAQHEPIIWIFKLGIQSIHLHLSAAFRFTDREMELELGCAHQLVLPWVRSNTIAAGTQRETGSDSFLKRHECASPYWKRPCCEPVRVKMKPSGRQTAKCWDPQAKTSSVLVAESCELGWFICGCYTTTQTNAFGSLQCARAKQWCENPLKRFGLHCLNR